jgi:hypothetical protein
MGNLFPEEIQEGAMDGTGSDNGTEDRIDLQQVTVVRAVAAQAARRAMRRSLLLSAAATATMIMLLGVLDIWVSNRWLWFPLAMAVFYVTMRAADRAEKSGPVLAKPTRRIVFSTAGVGLAAALIANYLFVVPALGSGIWTYVVAAAVLLAVGSLSAWWVAR